jgi:hypothetical protein
MSHKHDTPKDEVEGIAQRLHSERPEPSPFELDRIKTSAMSRAGKAPGRLGARRLAVTGLTVGLLAAGTGGVIAGVRSVGHSGDAAVAQYGNPHGGVLGSKTSKKKTRRRRIRIHIKIPHGAKLKKVTVKVNGKIAFVPRGTRASTHISLTRPPCDKGATTVVVIAVTDSGQTITQSHTYRHLC